MFRIVAPDGREVYPRGRIEGVFEWSFTATQSGRYVLEFDNTYSILSPKTIDLTIFLYLYPNPNIILATLVA